MKYMMLITAAILTASCGDVVALKVVTRGPCTILPTGQYICAMGHGTIISPIDLTALQGLPGAPGAPGESCTVTDSDRGAVITCPDGSSVELFDGEDGQDGTTVTIVCLVPPGNPDKRVCRGISQ